MHVDRDKLLTKMVVPESEIDLSIDRRRLLRDLFHQVADRSTVSESVEAWVRYLQDRIAHPAWPPMHSQTVMVTDPVWILENRLGQCGQTNRLLVDGMLAVGIPARLVQLVAHVASEAFYDGQWHYLDADWLNIGQFVRKADGTIPSTAEIYADQGVLNSVRAGREFDLYPAKVTHPEAPYETMFRRVKVGQFTTPYYLVKTATPQQERDVTFGWNYYRIETE